MRRVRLGLAVLLVALVAIGPPARAEKRRQLDARQEPEVSGPLFSQGRNCSKEVLRSGGRRVGSGRSCIFAYSFDPLFEYNVLDDYGVAWLQIDLAPARGLCITEVSIDVGVSYDGYRESSEPSGARARRTIPFETTMITDAGGWGLGSGRIHQEYLLRAGLLQPVDYESKEHHGVRLIWVGESNKTVALVAALEFAHTPFLYPQVSAGFHSVRFVAKPGC